MLLFTKEYIQPILSGEKTSTDRLWKKCWLKVGNIYYAANGYSKERRFARIKIVDIVRSTRREWTDEFAQQRGYKHRLEMLSNWSRLNHTEPHLNDQCFTLHFELVEVLKQL